MPENVPQQLLVFTRYPQPGVAKTRLIPSLGSRGAANLQRRMTQRTVAEARKMGCVVDVDLCIIYAGGSPARMRRWLGPGLTYEPQGRGDLGQRMAAAFERAFTAGAKRAVLVGTDVPQMTAHILASAFKALHRNDIVLGPATDGGYYLIGLSCSLSLDLQSALFSHIAWGSAKVLEQTLAVCRRRALAVATLKTLGDVDRPEDLEIWRTWERGQERARETQRISVVIPTLNESRNIESALASVGGAHEVETIVVDGGSSDQTTAIAAAQGAIVLRAAPPRARQMNRGALAAGGEIFLFLHADTRLPPTFDVQVRRLLAHSGTVAGAFGLKIDLAHAGIRIIERVVSWRSRLLGLPYGDQGLFLRSKDFFAVGGFPNIPIMEDFILVRQLANRGRVVTAPTAVQTSGRRWSHLGILRTTVLNQAIVTAYLLGISPDVIASWYQRQRYTLSQ